MGAILKYKGGINHMFSIGVDVGGSHIAVCAFDHLNKCLIKETHSYEKINPYGSKDEILESWENTIRKSIQKLGKPIKGIGLAMPGPFDYYEGICKINNVEKFQSLFNVNLRLEIAKRLKLNPSQIRFINDAAAFAIAEAWIGPASVYGKMVAITLGTGLGASFILNGAPILKGENVPDSGYLYNQDYKNILADRLFSTRGIIEAYSKMTGQQINNVKELYDKVGVDRNAKPVFENFGSELGDFLRPYLEEFGAEILVLGGKISKAFDVFGNSLKNELDFLEEIYVSEFGEDAAIVGSALLLEDVFYSKIEDTLKLM